MRLITSFCLLSLSGCFSVPNATCDPEISRAEILSAIKEEIRTTGGNPNVVDDPATKIEIAADGCEYAVRLTFASSAVGDWMIYTVSRAGRVTDVFTGY